MKVIIVGCGRVGAGLAKSLSLRGHTLTVIDQDAAALEHLGSSFKGQKLPGLGFDRQVLLAAGIEHCDALAAVTGSDEANVVIARAARLIFRVPRVVARLYDPRKAAIYRRLDLQIITPVGWGINRLTELLTLPELNPQLSLGSGELDLFEVEVMPLLVGRKVSDIGIPGEMQVIAISRDGKTFLPSPATVFEPEDHLHLLLQGSSSERVKTLFGAS